MDQRKDVVLSNAVLWARKPMSKVHGSMRVRDGKILEISARASFPKESLLDLKGMHVIPGLIDAHRHFFIWALLPNFGDASSWKSKEDALAAIESACMTGGPDKGWVFFSRLDHTRWKTPALPPLRDIDAAAKGSPVLVMDTTCHKGFISTEALRRSRIRRDALRCPGDIDIRAGGMLKGTVWEDALHRILSTMYREIFRTYSEEDKRKIILDEADRCLQMGLTHVHDPGVSADIQKLLKEAQRHTPLKISWSVTAEDGLCIPPALKDEMGAIHSDHAPRSAKFFLDGANRTAACMPVVAGLKAAIKAARESISLGSFSPLSLLLEQKITVRDGKLFMPYQRFEDTRDLLERARVFTDKGYRLVVHALGNVAALQAAELVKKLAPAGASVEHMLVMGEKDLDTFACCGAVASIQPGFIPFYAESIERMGVLPYLKTFPLKSLIQRGVAVCVSSDGPCGADDPLHNIRRAVDRKKTDGSVLDPGEGISQVEALTAGTMGGSASLGLKNNGLSEGEAATFCIVDGDPFSDTSRVVQTWIEGKRAS
ncbi:MAG TPA: amidohydrolase family protein [Desulfomonilia bacterium]|nr:amidohydrolase family protein [Desulfomonilia bacterium]